MPIDQRHFKAAMRQLPFAAKDAINKTILAMQERERKMISRQFKVRKTAFIMRRVKIFKFAKHKALTAIIGIDNKVQGSKLLMSQFEEGGTKSPQGGSIVQGRVAIPLTGTKARREFSKSVPYQYRLNSLAMASTITRKGKGGQITGKYHTVILPITKGKYTGDFALFQWTGKTLVPLYLFISAKPRLRSQMTFVRTARAVAKVVLPRAFAEALNHHIRGMRV